ncbi:hypothetical protein AB0B13_28680 [Streptomyces sp. NPDC042898]|uniref:hypothetical protein n=1 Tax=Streptomyces sp. NPDC042898 TaxID=3154334 RepID=UPI0033DA468C
MSSLEKIAGRRAELDQLAEALAKRLAEVDAEREELAVAERVLRRLYEQEAEAAAGQDAGLPERVQVGGRPVLKVPHRSEVADASALPGDYQRMLQIVKAAGGPVMVKDVGAELGIEVSVPGRLELPVQAAAVHAHPAVPDIAAECPSEEDRLAVAQAAGRVDRGDRARRAAA